MDLQDAQPITSSWLATVFFGLLIIYGITKLRNKKKLADGIKPMSALPGPPALPIIGNLTQMMGYKRPQTHIQWTKWAKKYGPLYRVQMPGSTFVVVADPALLPTVLGRPGLPKSRVYELGFFLATKTFHDTMFSIRHTSDPMWKATRKTLALAFNPDAIRRAPTRTSAPICKIPAPQ
ncbi:probableTRL5 Cytochrome P450 monooxygenase patH [Coccomyxa sp. Obi]|nr:probableTRL5 Cytochrome P450 monooxygenase patH [Coccomyxa sp. Obi]